MNGDRRGFLAGAAALGALGAAGCTTAAGRQAARSEHMHGLIGKMDAKPGQREALIAILLEGVTAMPGCLSYVVARDPADADAIWITEVWDSAASHKASLELPAVQAAIAKARPIIAGFGERRVTEPVGGHGLLEAPHRSSGGPRILGKTATF